jgi:hypothetical protein
VTLANAAAELAAKLVDDLETIDCEMHLKITFKIEGTAMPDRHGYFETTSITREALYTADEWNWTKKTELTEWGVAR